MTTNALIFRRLGVMSYAVTERSTGRHLGYVFHTGRGWSAFRGDDPSVRGHERDYVTQDYPGSRQTAAQLLRSND